MTHQFKRFGGVHRFVGLSICRGGHFRGNWRVELGLWSVGYALEWT